MCGIVGYTGRKQAQPILFNALRRLEYRGYDSCGIAIKGSGIRIIKDALRVDVLSKASPLLPGTIGIGHTRWATHGPPSQRNAHPHFDCTGKFAVVHNGIIENYAEIKKRLIAEGHYFVSETDTEVLSHLIEKYYAGDIERAVTRALYDVEGSYAIAVLSAEDDMLIAARKDSPLIIGIGDREKLIASDVPALMDYTNTVVYLENGDIAVVSPDKLTVKNDGAEKQREEHKISWSQSDIKKDGYEHFMLKEIYEQPRVIQNTLDRFAELNSGFTLDGGTRGLSILACGTSYHAGLIGKHIFEDLLKIPVRVEIASEFDHQSSLETGNEAIAITQSGETADVLAAIKSLKEAGVNTIIITNTPGSTASRLATRTLYTSAGPEVSVAATKTFIAQLMVLYQIALACHEMNKVLLEPLKFELRQMPRKVEQMLDNEPQIIDLANFISGYDNVFFIGRGINYPVALEGALKLKEISYIHAEGYPAGELKHGPFALLDEKTPVVAILTDDKTSGAMMTSIKEVKARNSPVIAIAPESDQNIGELADSVITTPGVAGILSPIVNTVALQLLAYHAARFRGCPIDFPRNLAKSVTVK